MRQKKIKADDGNLRNILIFAIASSLGEVVVIGYGTQSKKKISLSISEINTDIWPAIVV